MRFLRQLRRNNNREWFLKHKATYEEKVKKPMLEAVQALGGVLSVVAPEMETDPRRSIFRIYRDTRFSADKSPYKTQVAAVFWPRGMTKHACASLYFHIAPEEVLIGGGIYMPAAGELRLLRHHIAGNWEGLHRITTNRSFKRYFGELQGEQLARVPRGYPADHPAAELLRYKQYLAYVLDPPELAESSKLLPRISTLFGALVPLVRFLNAPLRQSAPGVVR